MSEPTVGRCPLCGASGGTAILEISYADVWSRMKLDWGVEFSGSVRAANAPGPTCSLVHCERCGLERFEPMAPGDADFYKELMSGTPYVADRWDFALARSLIEPNLDLVDFGCGDGRFLETLGPRSGRTVGVDHNVQGIDTILRRGGEAYCRSFTSFAEAEPDRFDVVTTFHTMEHVSDPMVMARAAATCLRPDGWMVISVPNRERTWKEEGEPMDRPPHHVTRWGPEQLRALADRVGLVVETIGFEPPDVSTSRALREREVQPHIRFLPGSTGRLTAKIVARLSVGPRRHDREVARDGYAARGIFGHSVAVVLRKRPAR
jgi:SAM-dependent methyltransferase